MWKKGGSMKEEAKGSASGRTPLADDPDACEGRGIAMAAKLSQGPPPGFGRIAPNRSKK
jgi:hypothetical protein